LASIASGARIADGGEEPGVAAGVAGDDPFGAGGLDAVEFAIDELLAEFTIVGGELLRLTGLLGGRQTRGFSNLRAVVLLDRVTPGA
jgi:hypothetical protein